MYIILTILTFITLMPLLWMLSASIKTDSEVFSTTFRWIPEVPQWKNYQKIWTKIPLLTFAFNSVKLTVIITIVQVVTSSFAAYGFSKCKFKGRDVLFLMYVATIAIPWQVYMLPQYSMMNKFHLVDSHLGYVLMQSFTAFGVFLMRQFFMSLPKELEEAALLDGCNRFQIFGKIMLPLTKAGIVSLVIFTAKFAWNDFMWPLIVNTSMDKMTLGPALSTLQGQYTTKYPMQMAGAVMAVIPIIVLFFIFQKQFIEGVAQSGIKG